MCISEVVQQVWKYLDINFHASNLNGYGVMHFFVIILNMFFYKNFVVNVNIRSGHHNCSCSLVYQLTWLDGSLSKYNSGYHRNKNETVIVNQFKNSQKI